MKVTKPLSLRTIEEVTGRLNELRVPNDNPVVCEVVERFVNQGWLLLVDNRNEADRGFWALDPKGLGNGQPFPDYSLN